MATKNRYTKPLDPMIPTFVFQGLPLPIIADMPEGGFVQFITGDNAFGQAEPGPKIEPGCMLAIIPAQAADQIRPHITQMRQAIGANGGVGILPT